MSTAARKSTKRRADLDSAAAAAAAAAATLPSSERESDERETVSASTSTSTSAATSSANKSITATAAAAVAAASAGNGILNFSTSASAPVTASAASAGSTSSSINGIGSGKKPFTSTSSSTGNSGIQMEEIINARELRNSIDALSLNSLMKAPTWYTHVRLEHQAVARKLVEEVDWEWAQALPEALLIKLSTYQLFMLCKFVAKDYLPKVRAKARPLLSPPREIDNFWQEHISRSELYLTMHKVVLGDEFVELLERNAKGDRDPKEEKEKRLKAFYDYIEFLIPDIIENQKLALSQQAPSTQSEDTPMKMKRQRKNTRNDGGKMLYLFFKYRAGLERILRLHCSSAFSEIAHKYADAVQLPGDKIRFLYKGQPVPAEATPESLQMVDMDEVFVQFNENVVEN